MRPDPVTISTPPQLDRGAFSDAAVRRRGEVGPSILDHERPVWSLLHGAPLSQIVDQCERPVTSSGARVGMIGYPCLRNGPRMVASLAL
jgi:hypothetical protein